MVKKNFKLTFALCLLMTVTFCFFTPYLYAHVGTELESRDVVCFKEFPTDPALFNDLVRPYVKELIEKHGMEEWKATLLTNELHRHLGLWSIVGAKMGIRAREILEAPAHQLDVISFAGNKPPWSCLNDGLQVSTGSSLSRGTISIGHIGKPVVVFIFKKKQVTLKVKPEVIQTVRRIIKEYSKKYTFQSPVYFEELNKISMEYWLKWDRNKMFEEIHD